MKYLLSLIFIIYFNYLNAQILNIESFRLEKDTSNIFLGSVSFGYSSKKQISNVSQFSTNCNAAYLTKLHSIMIISNLTFVKALNQNVVNQGYAHFRINFYRKKLLSFEQFSQLQYDNGRGLANRYLTGLCIRYRIHSSQPWNLSVNTGFIFEHEDWVYLKDKNSSNYIKSSSNLSYKIKINPFVSFYSTIYYQALPEKIFGFYRFISDSCIQIKMSNKLNFITHYIVQYDNSPIIQVPNFTYSFISSIQYNF